MEQTLLRTCKANGLRAITASVMIEQEGVTLYLHPSDENIPPCFSGHGATFKAALADGLAQIADAKTSIAKAEVRSCAPQN